MKKQFSLLLLLICSSGFSQISFQNGYFIDNNNVRNEGYIKNYDWKNNPTSFEFKKKLEEESVDLTIDAIKEFGINNKVAFVKSEVEIERSSTKINNISKNKTPLFNTETLFLKLIVSGNNKLYYYYNDGIEKFFYSAVDNQIKQLVFIKYKIDQEDIKNNTDYRNFEANSIFYNETYKKQLFQHVRCDETLASEPEKVKYTASDLSKYFVKINNCNGSTEKIEFEVKKTLVSFKTVAIVSKTSLSFSNYNINSSFDTSTNFGVGMEAEFIFPFNNYKWSLFLEPTISSIKEESTVKYGLNNSLTQKASVNYNQIQVPIGLRYYFDINKNSKIYLGSGLNINYVNDKTAITFENSNFIEYSGFTFNFLATIGYKYKRFSAEFRQYSNRNAALSQYENINVSQSSFALKYEFFKK